MANSIQDNRPSTLASAEDGLRAALVADAVIESMNNGGATERIPPTLASALPRISGA